MNYSTSPKLLIKASSVWTATGESLAQAALVVEAGKIAAILNHEQCQSLLESEPEATGKLEVIDLTDCVITPGLFNLHTHLDYSQAPAIPENISLFTWMAQLVASTRPWSPLQFAQSALAGAKAAALSGTTYLVDSSYTGQAAEAIAQIGLKGLVGLELFGLDETLAERIFELWQTRYQSLTSTASGALQEALHCGQVAITIAPHAPYTVSPTLWAKARDWAASQKLMLTAHLAESQAEYDWIFSQSPELDDYLAKVMPPGPKPFATLLNELTWRGSERSPTKHLEHFGLLDKNLIAAHCVKLDTEDKQIFAASKASAALCRRSNERLMTGAATASEFIETKIKFGFGSDSLASNSDLSMLKEAAAWLPQMTAEQALSLITIKAAEAVNIAEKTGSIAIGKAADLAAFPLSSDFWQNDHDQEAVARKLLECAPNASHLLVDGKFVVYQGKLLADS
ncbi:MAG: amidohydrolase family protein [Candidatus Obscuribacterales bacterium]|jgi:5-methylthioadenosine/S-adenosylhomocysteine deaminase